MHAHNRLVQPNQPCTVPSALHPLHHGLQVTRSPTAHFTLYTALYLMLHTNQGSCSTADLCSVYTLSFASLCSAHHPLPYFVLHTTLCLTLLCTPPFASPCSAHYHLPHFALHITLCLMFESNGGLCCRRRAITLHSGQQVLQHRHCFPPGISSHGCSRPWQQGWHPA